MEKCSLVFLLEWIGNERQKKFLYRQKEISSRLPAGIGKVFYCILRDWRKIFVGALVIAVIAGAGNFAIKRIQTFSEEYIIKIGE